MWYFEYKSRARIDLLRLLDPAVYRSWRRIWSYPVGSWHGWEAPWPYQRDHSGSGRYWNAQKNIAAPLGGRGVCFPSFLIYLPMNETCSQTTWFNCADPIHGSSEVAKRRHIIEGKESPEVVCILMQRYLCSDRRIDEDLVSYGKWPSLSYLPSLIMFLASLSLLLSFKSKNLGLEVRLYLLRFVDDLIEFQMRLLLCSPKYILKEAILSLFVPYLLVIANVNFVSFPASHRLRFSHLYYRMDTRNWLRWQESTTCRREGCTQATSIAFPSFFFPTQAVWIERLVIMFHIDTYNTTVFSR